MTAHGSRDKQPAHTRISIHCRRQAWQEASVLESSFPSWRALHAERLQEAAEQLAGVPGIRGLVLGGSVAREAHWPLSDIDIIPIWQAGLVMMRPWQSDRHGWSTGGQHPVERKRWT